MTNKEILNSLWEAYSETPFASFTLESKLNLSNTEYRDTLNLLSDLANSGEMRNGYIAKRVASTVYKLIKHRQSDCDSPSQPSPDDKESLTGQLSDDFSSADAENDPLERFSFFERGDSSKQSKHTGTIEQFINHVRTNAGWKISIEEVRRLEKDSPEQKAKKASLPAITASVEIISNDKKREGLREGEFIHTNLIQADFDKHPDPQALLEELKQNPYVRSVFASPRGKVKAFIKVSPVATIHEHDSAWEAVKQYCQAQGYGEIDEVPKAVNALCYISHDPNAVLKNASPLPWGLLPEQTPPVPRPKATATDNEKPTPEQMQEMLSFINADDYEIWMGIGMGLYREGYDFDLWDVWSQKSIKYGKPPTTADKMQRKWETFGKESVRSQIKPITLGSIFYHAKEGGWQPPPRQEYRHGYHTQRSIYRRRDYR